MKTFYPMLLTDLKSYSPKKFLSDVISGIIVAIIALPLSIALAIASGVAPEAGIYTAIIAGFLTSLLGGSNVQIAGPTAAFATIVAGIVAEKGLSALALATVIAGIFLILMGIFRLGTLIKFIPFSITTGFTAGIAMTLLIGQLKDFFGVTYQNGEAPIEAMEKLSAFFNNLGTINFSAVLVGAVCLIILFVLPRFVKKIPASLAAVVVGTAMVSCFHMNVNTIGDLYSVKSGLMHFTLPEISFSSVASVMPDALTIAVLAAIESLLSCVVADSMTGGRHRSNTELIAQGVANIGSALFGGIPATGAIARTAANIKNGGKTPVAGIVHSGVLLLVLISLMRYAVYIPMPAIAAILINVAYNMCGIKSFVKMVKTSPKSDILVLFSTFILTVVFDLVVAIEIGIIAACVLFMKRMSDESAVKAWRSKSEDSEDALLMQVPEGVNVYEFNGPLFFAVSERISKINPGDGVNCIILRMGAVPSLDTDALHVLAQLYEDCKEKNVRLLMSHVNPQPMKALVKSGLFDLMGEDAFLKNISAALEAAAPNLH